jgi:hypothetical protein
MQTVQVYLYMIEIYSLDIIAHSQTLCTNKDESLNFGNWQFVPKGSIKSIYLLFFVNCKANCNMNENS